MRRGLGLGVSLILLLAVLVLAWNHRYERIPGSELVTLDQLKSQIPPQKGMQWRVADGKPILQLTKREGDPSVILEIPLAAPAGCSMIHLRYTLNAQDLKPGRNIWEDGRLNMGWITPDQRKVHQVASVRHHRITTCPSVISVAPEEKEEPQLWIGHLGVSGVYEIHELEMTFVRGRAWWGLVSGILTAAAGGWILMALLAITQVSILRRLAAAIITLILILITVIPGPWVLQKPLIADSFELGSIKDHAAPKPIAAAKAEPPKLIVIAEAVPQEKATPPLFNNQFSPPPPEPAATVPVTKPTAERTTVMQGNWMLDIKYALKRFKIILHSLLFGAALLVLAGLIGLRPAVYVSVFLALSTELAQIAFRYGSDATDLLDLLFDAIGIAAGVCLVLLVKRRKKCSGAL